MQVLDHVVDDNPPFPVVLHPFGEGVKGSTGSGFILPREIVAETFDSAGNVGNLISHSWGSVTMD